MQFTTTVGLPHYLLGIAPRHASSTRGASGVAGLPSALRVSWAAGPWRSRRFAAQLGQEFLIDRRNLCGLPAAVARGLRRYNLSYIASRVPQSETTFIEDDWKSCVFFQVRAQRYPDIVTWSANPRRPEMLGHDTDGFFCVFAADMT